jgi:hypothetical protein
MAFASYANAADLGTYLDGADATANATIWATLLEAASRFVDEKCHRFFYDDGASERWFDVTPVNGVSTTRAIVYRDFFTVTQIRLLHAENADIADATKYDILAGTGIAPPSNYWLLPRNPELVGNIATPTLRRPFYGLQLTTTPVANTSPPGAFTQGYGTLGITANWGWPCVPDLVKNLTLKIAARAWQSKSTGWTDLKGDPQIGMISIARHFDSEDQFLLQKSDLISNYPS